MINKRGISLTCWVVQKPGNIVSDMDGEKVMMNINNGNYYNLGTIGGRIWGLIDTPVTVGEVVSALMDEYDVEQAACEEQVISFLQHLSEENLIDFDEVLRQQLSS